MSVRRNMVFPGVLSHFHVSEAEGSVQLIVSCSGVLPVESLCLPPAADLRSVL